jgi:hypothetical protein
MSLGNRINEAIHFNQTNNIEVYRSDLGIKSMLGFGHDNFLGTIEKDGKFHPSRWNYSGLTLFELTAIIEKIKEIERR